MRNRPGRNAVGMAGLAACTLVLAGCGLSNSPVDSSPDRAVVGGMQIARSPAELSFLADVVVIATAGEVATQPFTANPSIPIAARNEIGYEDGSFARSTVRVEDTLKGDSRGEISVAWLSSLTSADGSVTTIEGSDSVALREDQRYILFLSRGTKLWTGHHIPLGIQGVGKIEGPDVLFLTGQRMTLAKVIAGAEAPTAPPTEQAPPGK